MTEQVRKDRGERFALHQMGKQHILPAAASARAVFEACGGAEGWKSWIAPNGKMIKLALEVMGHFVDDHPDAPAEALYIYLTNYPASGMTPPDGRAGRIFDKRPVPWADAPMQVRGASEAFRAVYLQLWRMVCAHDEKMARRPPPRPLPSRS
jgi:hypothetical protein